MKEALESLFENHQKKIMVLPILLIVVSVVFLITVRAETGEYFQKDSSLSGGMIITLYTEQEVDIPHLETTIKESFSELRIRTLSEFGTSKTIGIVIETIDINENLLTEKIREATGITLTEENSSIEVVGSSLGESFYNQMVKALIFAFAFMSITIFITFRKVIPSIAVVIVAFGDLAITVAIINLLNFHISSAGIAALLLLVGYSIDTDVLLTTRVLKKRDGTIMEGVFSSMKTGLTMTFSTMAAMLVAYFVSTSLILKQMFIIIVIGLIVDIILTYMLNAPMIALYAKRKGGSN